MSKNYNFKNLREREREKKRGRIFKSEKNSWEKLKSKNKFIRKGGGTTNQEERGKEKKQGRRRMKDSEKSKSLKSNV